MITAGTSQAVTLEVGATGVAGFFQISLPTCKYEGATKNYGGEMGQTITLPFKAYGATDGVMATFAIADAVDRGW